MELVLRVRTARDDPHLLHRSQSDEPPLLQAAAAQAVQDRGVQEEAARDHYGYDDHHLRPHSGTADGQVDTELRADGLVAARRVCLAAGRDLHLAAAAREGRPDQERLLYLRPPRRHRIHRHRVPHHPHTRRGGQHLPAADTTAMHYLAMVGDQDPQSQRAAIGHVLHLYLADGVHRLCRLLVGGLHADGRATAHLVDHAADVYPDNHLYQPVSQTLR